MLTAALAAHADWSVDPRKRWITCAYYQKPPLPPNWRVAAPMPVGAVDTLLSRLLSGALGGPVVLGVDLPLGLPRAYVERHVAEPDFPAFLRSLAVRPGFFDVATTLDEVSAQRPFYPQRGMRGMTRSAHAAALGLDSADGLCRRCDRATRERPAGAPLFWTLGANQSGKAAIAGWRDLLLPALRGNAPPQLWPFEGRLGQLLRPGRVAIAETYPAEAMRHFRLRLSGSKCRQSDRLALAPSLALAMRSLGAEPDAGLLTSLADGFGGDTSGEDRFDSVLGLLCVLNVLAGNRPDDPPDDPWLTRWEGWVLGQTALPAIHSSAGSKRSV